MIDKKSFKKTVATPLEKAGFQKKGQSWSLSGQDTVVTLRLQKSDWWEIYFIEVDIQLKTFYDFELPPKGEYLFNDRLEQLFPNKRDLIQKRISLDSGNPEALIELSEFIESDVVPFLKECTSFANLREKLKSGIFRQGLITVKAKELLS